MPASLLILNCSVSNWPNFPVVKQQLLMIVISLVPEVDWAQLGCSDCSLAESCRLDGGWVVRLQTGWNQLANSFYSHAGVWAERIQPRGWGAWISLLHLSNTAAWGVGDFQTWLRSSKLCGLREHAEPDTSIHILVICGSYERVSPSSGRGISLHFTRDTGRVTKRV